jgi:gluconate 2-dehydrogenase gamma chain
LNTNVDRRTMLRLLASAPMAAGFAWSDAEASRAHGLAQAAQTAAKFGTPFRPTFFTAHEWEMVRVLVDIIIPRDERSGSATEAGVPEFMDFMMLDEPKLPEESRRQTSMRGGLAWLDLECQRRHDKTFLACSDTERAGVLDDISWPVPRRDPAAPPEFPNLASGRAFFNSFRDLTASGFWTSKLGMADLQYLGNRYVAEWTGCPDEALKKLGVSYPSA